MAEVAKHLRITGRVQGVFFRAWMQQQARELGVSGWVRNCPDGRVEAHAEGDAQAVDQLLRLARDGPPSAKVEDLRVWDVAICDFDGFEVRP